MTEKKSYKSLLIDLLFRHNVRWAFYFRLQSKGQRWAKIGLYRLSRKYGIEVSSTAKIGKGIYLGHLYNITIGKDAELGENVNLSKGCTIGTIITGNHTGSPKIGNCVFVGVNAAIVGGVTVGDDVLIAPNAFVNFDVPSHSIVIGNPGQIHPKQNATEGYILNRV